MPGLDLSPQEPEIFLSRGNYQVGMVGMRNEEQGGPDMFPKTNKTKPQNAPEHPWDLIWRG